MGLYRNKCIRSNPKKFALFLQKHGLFLHEEGLRNKNHRY